MIGNPTITQIQGPTSQKTHCVFYFFNPKRIFNEKFSKLFTRQTVLVFLKLFYLYIHTYRHRHILTRAACAHAHTHINTRRQWVFIAPGEIFSNGHQTSIKIYNNLMFINYNQFVAIIRVKTFFGIVRLITTN